MTKKNIERLQKKRVKILMNKEILEEIIKIAESCPSRCKHNQQIVEISKKALEEKEETDE